MDKVTKLRVRVYTSASILEGNILKPTNLRLLDILNGLSFEGVEHKKDFINITEVSVQNGSLPETVIASVYVNKANIFFVEEIDGLQASYRLTKGSATGFYPYVEKRLVIISFYLPQYVLTGNLHYGKKQNPGDLLNSNLQFLPLTDVNIKLLKDNREKIAKFIAVNRQQILYMEEKAENQLSL